MVESAGSTGQKRPTALCRLRWSFDGCCSPPSRDSAPAGGILSFCRARKKVSKARGAQPDGAVPLGIRARRATWSHRGRSQRQRTRRSRFGIPRARDPAHVRRTQAEAGSEARRVRCRCDLRVRLQVARRADPPQREERAEWCCIQPLCFGDFHLGLQMKVTRPPGRDPAPWHATVFKRRLRSTNRNWPTVRVQATALADPDASAATHPRICPRYHRMNASTLYSKRDDSGPGT